MSPKPNKNANIICGRDAGADSGGKTSQSRCPAFFRVKQRKFIRLGKDVAPAAEFDNDRFIAELALEGVDPAEIANRTGQRSSEITLRLVELSVGPLGRVRPAGHRPSQRGFQDVSIRDTPSTIPLCQRPVLSLAADVFGGDLQRLGDRLYLSGREASLPEIVCRAREKGVRIRYPRIDPMEGAWSGGPSRRERRAGTTFRPGEGF